MSTQHCPHCGGEIEAKKAAAILGSAKTPKKADSSRANGKMGGRRAALQEDLTPTRPFDPKGPEVEVLHLPEPKPRKRRKGEPEAPQEIQVEPAPARPWGRIVCTLDEPPKVERLPDLKYTGETSILAGVTRYEYLDADGRKRWTITPPRPKAAKNGPC